MNLIQASRVEKETGKYIEALALVRKDEKYFNLLDQEVPIDPSVVFEPLPKRIYTPIWDFSEKVWKEGLSQEEIEEIQNRPDPPDPLKVMAEEVKALQEALSYLLLGGEKD
ncbi:hypothetical protein ABNC49_13970 [Paenibacillus larvae]